MPAYHYTALNADGHDQKGVIEADSEKHARQLLREKSLIPVKLRITHGKKLVNSSLFNLQKKQRTLSAKELALLTRQIATLISAGLPAEEALLAVAEQIEKPHLKGLLLSIRSKVLEGHALARTLGEYPEAFSPLYCATVAAGESTGHLDVVLTRLADYTEQQWHMRQKLKTAMIYPSMIVLVAIAIVGFLLEFVVPKMIAVYGNLHQDLPGITQVLIGVSDFVLNFGLYVVIAIVLSIFIFRRALKVSTVFKANFHKFLLRLPLFGYAIKTADTARFARTLSILTASGVPALEAMKISAQLIGNIPIKKSVEEAVARVREGAAIHLSLKQTGYFPPMSIHMIASGEASSQLENMLERVANNQEGEILRLIEVILALFEPAIILIMGAIVLFIVLAVLLPIFQLNQIGG